MDLVPCSDVRVTDSDALHIAIQTGAEDIGIAVTSVSTADLHILHLLSRLLKINA